MSRLIIVAGPQAAGKSTVVAKLGLHPYAMAPLFPDGNPPLFFCMQESRQIIVHKHMLLGGIFMEPAHEREVIRCDLERMQTILRRAQRDVLYLDECNIFTIAHATAHGVREAHEYWDAYIELLTQLQAVVVFIDVPPEISWERRQGRYEQRLVYFAPEEHESILNAYRTYLFKTHPALLEVYEHLPFPKKLIDGRASEENVLKAVCQSIASLVPTHPLSQEEVPYASH